MSKNSSSMGHLNAKIDSREKDFCRNDLDVAPAVVDDDVDSDNHSSDEEIPTSFQRSLG